MTDAGLDRIRRFSRVTWIVGAVVIIAISTIAFPGIYRLADGSLYVQGSDEYFAAQRSAWFQENPAELEVVDGVITGTADGGYVELEPGAAPMQVLPVNIPQDDYIAVRQSPGEWHSDDYTSVYTVIYMYDADDTGYVLPGRDGGRLWLDSDRPNWQVRLAPLQTTALDGTVEGSGPAVLEYDGDALSARFTHSGDGIFRVSVAASGEDYRLAVNDVDEVSTRASWANPGTVLLVIDSPGDGTWTVAADE